MYVFILLPHEMEMEMEKRVKRFFATNRYKYLSYERNLTLSCNIFKKVMFAGIAKTIRVSTRSERSKRVLMSTAQPYYLIFIGPFVKKPCALEYDENWSTAHTFFSLQHIQVDIQLDVVDSHYTSRRIPAQIHLNSKNISFHLICVCVCECCTLHKYERFHSMG